MAVVSVNEIWKGRGGAIQINTRTYSRVYQVVCNAASDSAYTVRTAAGLPSIGDSYPDDTAAKCVAIAPEQQDDRLDWLVTVRYSTSTTQLSTSADDPLDRDPVISWGRESVERIAVADVNGAPVHNYAGEPFDPPPSIPHSRLVCRIVRNEASYAPDTAAEYLDSVNSAGITVAGLSLLARQGLLREFSGEKKQEAGDDFWEVTYEIVVADIDDPVQTTWDFDIAEVGWHYLYAADDRRRCWSGSGGEYSSAPMPLDTDGTQLSPNATPPVLYSTWRLIKEKSWAALSLPTS